MKIQLTPNLSAYRSAAGKMIMPTELMISEFKVHETLLSAVLSPWHSGELVDGPQEMTVELMFESVVAATALSADRQSSYLAHGILPHSLVLDRVVDPLFDSLGFQHASASDKADVALILETMTLRFYAFMTEFMDMVGFTEYQCETIEFSHWQGRDAVITFNDY